MCAAERGGKSSTRRMQKKKKAIQGPFTNGPKAFKTLLRRHPINGHATQDEAPEGFGTFKPVAAPHQQIGGLANHKHGRVQTPGALC